MKNSMKNYLLFPLLFASMILLGGCAVVGGIFKAGVWVGVLAVVAFVVVIVFIIKGIGNKP
jgi:Ni,Fe-hydrogenase III small subunit